LVSLAFVVERAALLPEGQLGELAAIAAVVNAAGSTWQAQAPSRFGNLEDVKTTLGTWLKGHPQYVDNKLEVADLAPGYILSDIPSEFDARVNFTNCTVISRVRDQSSCGSCWAFGSTEAFEDSRCIATGDDVTFSTADTAGCCSGLFCGMSQGCNGGQPSSALSWMTKTGVVTGGDYFDIGQNNSGCKPYEFAPCAHHVPPSSRYPACPSEEYSISCKKSCSESTYGKSYSADKTKGTKAFSLSSEAGMQTAIMTTGPLAVAFSVYSDFPTYKSGVYQHVSGDYLGGHAVEAVGWGVENGQKYWLIKNSWNDQWGAGGFFKILRGSNECGIEDDVTGVRFE